VSRNLRNVRVLSLGLSLVGAAACVPPIGLVLMLLSEFLDLKFGFVWMGLGAMLLVSAGALGQILCLFGPLSPATRVKLVVATGLLVASWQTEGFLAGISALAGMGAYAVYLYGLCDDLESPAGRQSFNQAALYALMGLGSLVVGGLLGRGAGMVVGILGVAAFLLAGARFAWSYFVLVQAATRLQETLVDVEEAETGLRRY